LKIGDLQAGGSVSAKFSRERDLPHKSCLHGIAEFTGLEFAGLENDGLENNGVEQEERYIGLLHTMK